MQNTASRFIPFSENGLHLVLEITAEGDPRLVFCSNTPFAESELPVENQRRWRRLLQVQATGENQNDHHGAKQTGTLPGANLRYLTHRGERNRAGRKIEIDLHAPALAATIHWQFYGGLPVFRAWTELRNNGSEDIDLEHVSSFHFNGLFHGVNASWPASARLHIPHNTWYGEAQWRTSSLAELGLEPWNTFAQKRIAIASTGTWSTHEHLPMGVLENSGTGSSLFWQIENNGSWAWELSTMPDLQLYLNLSGPSYRENHWLHRLRPGAAFTSVPVAVGQVSGGLEEALQALTAYRRLLRRPHRDTETLPVIFNDYMNCLWGNPTEENLPPLIAAAADAGCEYFCIDAGWYADAGWWADVGEWQPSARRFPNGIEPMLARIRAHGMVPGLWLELEVMGIFCPMASRVPDAWFFQRNGKRLIDHGRYQLDFRNAEVLAHATGVVRRLVETYGVGYIKMDYNQNLGPGTDFQAASCGDGLLQHNRAYLASLEEMFDRYPALVIENCGSGGMRMDYALLARHSIQSSSDQTEYEKMAVIAASVLSAVTPEQCATWSYPKRDATREVAVINMVNALLMRIHQSGHLAELSPECLEAVKEGLAYYKTIRHLIPQGVPLWPLGLPRLGDHWLCSGLETKGDILLAVWRLGGENSECLIPLRQLDGKKVGSAYIGYPKRHDSMITWNEAATTLHVNFPTTECARLIRLQLA